VSLWFTPSAHAQVAKLYPVDEAVRDPSFFVFRARLLRAVHERDESFLLSILAPEIKSSFGGEEGIEDFKTYWGLDRPDTEVWQVLLSVLILGGSFQGDSYFVAPYVNSRFPGDLNGYEHGVIVEEMVPVRREPTAASESLAVLSFDIVRVTDWTPVPGGECGQQWIPVELGGGTQGFVLSGQIRSPIDYRAMFEKTGEKWILTILVAGD
jgi:hypothetical protein